MERGRGGKRKGGGDHLPYFSPTGFCLKYRPAATSHQLQLSDSVTIPWQQTIPHWPCLQWFVCQWEYCTNVDETLIRHQSIISSASLQRHYLHLLLSSILNLGRESKVSDLHHHGVVDEHVAEFEVAMYHVFAVDVLTALDQLTHEEPYFRLSQCLPGL